MQIEKRKVAELKYYPGNPRTMSKEVFEKLKKSLQEFGIVDPLVINKNNEVIGGNQRLRAIKELGIDEVDCVVVDLPKSKEKALNIALNKIQGEFDEELLKSFIEDIEPLDLELTGLDDSEIALLEENTEEEQEDNYYTHKIETIHYEPTGIKPALEELYDAEKYEELLKEIDASELPEDEKNFLRLAASRFIQFNFSKIADYYANSEKDTQKLFEKLALVIIDFNDAILNGFVEFDRRLQNILSEDDSDA
jgi:hypothetical protein